MKPDNICKRTLRCLIYAARNCVGLGCMVGGVISAIMEMVASTLDHALGILERRLDHHHHPEVHQIEFNGGYYTKCYTKCRDCGRLL